MSTRVSVFGGSQAKPGEPLYQDAIQLGRLLAQAGYTCSTAAILVPWKQHRVEQLRWEDM
jgi:predicted Rossmann-fold nucleotide-binding protein